MSAFVVDLGRSHLPQTMKQYRDAFALFRRFLSETFTRAVTVEDLTRDMLAKFYDWLNDGSREAYTKQRIVNKLEAAWQWAFDNEWHPLIPRPKTIAMLVEPDDAVHAPSFDEMAACVRACAAADTLGRRRALATDGPRRLATILYFTGCRTAVAETIEWTAYNEARGTLTMPPQKGLPGYIIPLSPHFIAELATWPRDSALICGWEVVDAVVRKRLNEAWARAGVRTELWEGSPGRAFRRGLTSGLMEAGIEKEVAEVYVGRGIEGARKRYADLSKVPFAKVLAAIPPINTVVKMKERA